MVEDIQRVAAAAARQGTTDPAAAELFPSPSPGVVEIMSAAAGTTFAGGAYRLLRLDEVDTAVQRCVDLVPEAASRVRCFATDWLGRYWGYFVDEPRVVVVEPYSAEMLSAPHSVHEWHTQEIAEGFLEDELWAEWRQTSDAPGPAECVGLSVPMFLGGDLVVTNLSLFDRDVYWGICTQLVRQIADLPPGTSVDSVRLEP